jgi:phosphoribosylglycinamide formyltransferase-1
LLPAFPGIDGYGDAVRYGCKVAGCTVHFVDYGEDTGPIIGQKAFPIEAGDTLETVRRKGLAFEWQLYPECIQLYAKGRLKLRTRPAALSRAALVKRTVVDILPEKASRP